MGRAAKQKQHKSKIMNRIAQLDPTQATGKTQKFFEGIKAKVGSVPNVFRVLGNSPAALEGYLNLSGALAAGQFNAKIREEISLAVAETNLCEYCLSAHTYFGGKAGLTPAEIGGARQATAESARTDAILKLARNIVVQRGEISDADLAAARTAGLTDAEIVETVANVAVNIFTNYINHVAKTVVDFPAVQPGSNQSAPAAVAA